MKGTKGIDRRLRGPSRRPRSIASVAVAAVLGCLAILAGPATALASPCPNEPLRLGPSALLPGCRAYEMVSPVDKNKGGVSPAYNTFTSPDGESASFSSISAFAGTPATALDTTYLGHRGQTDWSTESVTPPVLNRGETLVDVLGPVNSPDMTKTLQYSTYALAPGAIEGGSNVYIRNNLTGSRELVVALASRALFNQISYQERFYISGNSDWSAILFESTVPLTGETTEGPHLYEFHDGKLELVDRRPEEQSGESPAFAKGVAPVATLTANTHPISADGSRVFFAAAAEQPDEGALFMRETKNGVSTTVPISTVQRPGPEEGEVVPATFGGASADGSVVYFTSNRDLTPDANQEQASAALYRYEPDTGELTDETPVPGSYVEGVLGLGEDGSPVYFSAGGVLAEGASPTERNYYVLDSSGQIEFIASGGISQWFASPDGHYLAFSTTSLLTGDARPGTEASCPTVPIVSNPVGECLEVYRFDATRGNLRCVSCNGLAPTGSSLIGGLGTRKESITGLAIPEAILNDGTVYLESTNALLPGDVNEKQDVYAVGAGAPELISTGTSPQPSFFGDATPTGSNVFFLTTQPLVKADVDSSFDVYDDREGGGFASQWPPGAPGVCEGEGCRGEAPSAPTPLAAGGAEGCDGLIVSSERAGARADVLNRMSRRATHHAKGAAAKKRAHRLRRQARTQRLKAKRIENQAKLCRRQGK